MKKLLLCLVAFATIAFVSCKKEKNPAEDFVGNYTVTATVHAQIPVLGAIDQDLDAMDASIALNGEEGNVTVSMAGQTTTGNVTEAGMTLQPIVTTQTIMGTNVEVTITFPVISKPVNGVSSWTSNITASINGIPLSGTADMTATRK
ncbi:MAG: hypothetical protein J6031_06570 [Bacteroidales bacterium]|nr:hypothetical protein [Bacteroidales bacterium]